MTTPAPIVVEPYGWTVDPNIISGWEQATAPERQSALDLGVYVVWALSGRRFGIRQIVVRPQSPPWQTCDTFGRHGYVLAGPVEAVDEVIVDGDVLDPGSYRAEWNTVYRLDGQPWPAYNDPTLDVTEPGTWQITYQRGVPVPGAALRAAAAMTGEVLGTLAAPQSPAGPPGLVKQGRIPPRAQSIAREGVSIEMVDPQVFLDGGKTGVPEVDVFLAAANPAKLMAPPLVWSPDTDDQGIINPMGWV